MRSAFVLLLALGVTWAQISEEDQSFIDAALGAGDVGGIGGGTGERSPVDTGLVNGGATNPGKYKRCDGGTKSCVPYYLCVNDNIVTDGAGLIDIRFGGQSGAEEQHVQHSDCGDQYTLVCCSDPQIKPTEPVIQPPSYQPSCGRRNPFGINARIVGLKDNESQFGEFPWMAAVLRRDAGKVVYVCGAALIAPNVLATAAHCVYSYQQNLVVRLGEWDTQNDVEFYPYVDADVASVVIHEGYNHERKNLYNDVALLFLRENVILQEHVDTICMPEAGAPPTYGEDCIVTGWGKDSFIDGRYQLVLKQVNLPLVDRSTCQSQMQSTRLGRRFLLHEGFVCAGGNGADACTGDGGSPLVCPDPHNPQRYILRGIVSWGIGCATVGVPGVYADVSFYNSWIVQKIQAYQG